MVEALGTPPRKRPRIHHPLDLLRVTVVEHEELDRGISESQQPEALEVVVELEAVVERVHQEQAGEDRDP